MLVSNVSYLSDNHQLSYFTIIETTAVRMVKPDVATMEAVPFPPPPSVELVVVGVEGVVLVVEVVVSMLPHCRGSIFFGFGLGFGSYLGKFVHNSGVIVVKLDKIRLKCDFKSIKLEYNESIPGTGSRTACCTRCRRRRRSPKSSCRCSTADSPWRRSRPRRPLWVCSLWDQICLGSLL